MRVALGACVFILGGAALFAQIPAATPEPAASPGQSASPAQTATPAPAAAAPVQLPQVENSDVGFSYSLTSDWETVAPPTAPKVTVPFPDAMGAKRGDACVEVVFTAKHGSPASVVVAIALPFACYGQTMKASDLANFGAGAAEGLKQTFEIADPVQGNYTLGGHAVWIERAKGTPKGHAGNPFTFEIACSVLAKGAVCWMTMAADAASLQAFEQAPVTLDGESSTSLVPANAFVPNQ